MSKRIEVEIAGDSGSLSRAVHQATGSLGGIVKTAAIVGAGFLVARKATELLTSAVHTGIDEWMQNTKVTAQTAAVLKSTGHAAHVSAQQVDELGLSLLKKSGVDDEVIRSGENVLLAFTHIRNEVGKGNDIFNQATKAALDFSVRTGRDMPQAALVLGKALEDPAHKLSGLAKAGIIFSEAQKKMVAEMVKAGDTLGAQKFVLAELEKRYGGAAEAAGKTLPGQLKILREEFNNFAGDMVAKAVPALLQFTGFLKDFAGAATLHAKLKVVWEGLQDVGTALFAAIGEAIHGHNERVRVDLNEWVTIHHEGAVEKLRTELMAEVNRINWGDVFVGMFRSIDWGALLSGAFHAIITISKTQWTIIAEVWIGAWRAILQGIATLAPQIPGIIRNAAGAALTASLALGHSIVSGIRDGLAAVLATVRGKIDDIPGAVRAFVGAALSAGASVGRAIMEGIGSGLRSLAGAVADQAAALVHGVVARIKAAAGIHSPSELFAREIGEPMAQGIIAGFTRTVLHQPMVEHAAAMKKMFDDWIMNRAVPNMYGMGRNLGEVITHGFGAGMGTTGLHSGFAEKFLVAKKGLDDTVATVGAPNVQSLGERLGGIFGEGFHKGLGTLTAPTPYGGGSFAGPGEPVPAGSFASAGGGGDLHVHIGTVIGTGLSQAAQEIRRELIRDSYTQASIFGGRA